MLHCMDIPRLLTRPSIEEHCVPSPLGSWEECCCECWCTNTSFTTWSPWFSSSGCLPRRTVDLVVVVCSNFYGGWTFAILAAVTRAPFSPHSCQHSLLCSFDNSHSDGSEVALVYISLISDEHLFMGFWPTVYTYILGNVYPCPLPIF